MKPAIQNVASEQAHFDRFYRERRGKVDPLDTQWLACALHPCKRPLDFWEWAFHLVGDIRGKHVLEIGCGGGWITRMLAAKGAIVSAIDISEEGCISTRLKLSQNGLPYDTVCVMDAHNMTFPAASFDLVFMAGTLHHVNLPKVLEGVRRILRPGGAIVCYEPMRYGIAMRTLKEMWLQLNGLSDHNHTDNEEALTDSDLAPFHEVFESGVVRKFNLLAKTNRLKNRFGVLAQTLRWVDYFLLESFPFLGRYCTCVVCRFYKNSAPS